MKSIVTSVLVLVALVVCGTSAKAGWLFNRRGCSGTTAGAAVGTCGAQPAGVSYATYPTVGYGVQYSYPHATGVTYGAPQYAAPVYRSAPVYAPTASFGQGFFLRAATCSGPNCGR